MEECGLYLGRQEVGRLRWERRQSRLWLEASCPYVPEQIYRLVVETETGLRPLGVMLPENGLFVLRREIPAGETPLRAVLDRSRPGESHLPGLPLAASAFSPAAEEEPLLLACARAGALESADFLDTHYVRFPLELGGACPFAPYFCLTEVLETDAGCWGVFCRKGEGDYQPLFPRSAEKDRLRGPDGLC